MLIGLILLVLVVVGLTVAFAAFVTFWVVMIVFWVSAIALALIFQDPHIGFFLAFPVTGLVFWALSANSEQNSSSTNK